MGWAELFSRPAYGRKRPDALCESEHENDCLEANAVALLQLAYVLLPMCWFAETVNKTGWLLCNR